MGERPLQRWGRVGGCFLRAQALGGMAASAADAPKPSRATHIHKEPSQQHSSCVSQPLPSLALEPSGRQVLRAELCDRDALETLFGKDMISALAHESRERDNGIKVRIRKMLELAFHPNTGDAESAQALKNAHKLMRAHKLAQSDVMTPENDHENDGGLHGVKLTPVHCDQRMRSNESWMIGLIKAVELTFDVGGFGQLSKELNANFIIFYGRHADTELAAFAYTCAFNRIDWMAGNRSLPPDQAFPATHEHGGKRFSDVLRMDPGYVDWATSQERSKGGPGDSLEKFVEYARAQKDPAEWDRAYKEGAALALRRQARDSRQVETTDGCEALVLSSKMVQETVLKRLGLKLRKKGTMKKAEGFRAARLRGSKDAAAVNLRQQQIDNQEQLALINEPL